MVKLILLFLCVAVCSARFAGKPPSPFSKQISEPYINRPPNNPIPRNENILRVRRRADDGKGSYQVDVNRGNGGTDVNAQAQARLWESQNKRNSLDGNAAYSQHFGGPYGRSKPNYGVGLTYRHRF